MGLSFVLAVSYGLFAVWSQTPANLQWYLMLTLCLARSCVLVC